MVLSELQSIILQTIPQTSLVHGCHAPCSPTAGILKFKLESVHGQSPQNIPVIHHLHLTVPQILHSTLVFSLQSPSALSFLLANFKSPTTHIQLVSSRNPGSPKCRYLKPRSSPEDLECGPSPDLHSASFLPPGMNPRLTLRRVGNQIRKPEKVEVVHTKTNPS